MSEGAKRPWYVWVLSGLLALAFAGAGFAKLTGQEEVLASFERFGLSPGFATFIGACELAGAIGLFLPRLAPVAASGLAIIMAGAVVNHLRFDPLGMAGPAAVLLVLTALTAFLRRGELRGGGSDQPAATTM